MASKVPKMNKQGPGANRKYATMTVPPKRDIISRLESGKSGSAFMALYNIGSSTVYDVKEQKV